MAKQKAAGAVTFRALASPKQFFSVGADSYRFNDGYFTTEDAAVIAFLRSNHAAEEVTGAEGTPE